VVLSVTTLEPPDILSGTFLEADAAEPFSVFHRTSHALRLRWTPATRIVMGDAADLRVGALLRAHSTLSADQVIEAEQIAVLTHVGSIVDE